MFDRSFSDFLFAVRGYRPMPWQAALAAQVLKEGWPAGIGVPTSLGKTATIDIAVWAIARESHLEPSARLHPTRIYYAVDRRLLVDEASEKSEELARLLNDPSSLVCEEALDVPLRVAVLKEAAAALLGRCNGLPSDDSGPLYVSSMRGGRQLGFRPPHPAKPAILCTTIAMYASRLLFQGYGVSQGLAPIDAALAGSDSLVLLDEAHLSPAMFELFGRLPLCDASSAGILRLPNRFERNFTSVFSGRSFRDRAKLVSLSATGASDGSAFMLGESDYLDARVLQRIEAAKPTELRECTTGSLAKQLATRCLELLDEVSEARSALIFVNSPVTAQKVIRELTASKKDVETLLLTGQLREYDADLARSALLGIGGIRSGRKEEPTRRLVVVATQTLEVGADIDVDVMVSELAGHSAVIQRLGRLNRRGDRPWARASLWFVEDAKPGGLYGDEIQQVRDALNRAGAITGQVNLAPRFVADVLGQGAQPTANTAQLLPVHLWEWAKTSTYDPTVAPVELFFAGRDDPDFTVSIAWRSEVSFGDLVPTLSERETLEVRLDFVREFLKQPGVDELWGRYNPTQKSVEKFDPIELRPGMYLIFDSLAGGYSPKEGWTGQRAKPGGSVLDMSPLIRRSMLLTAATLENLFLLNKARISDEQSRMLKALGDLLDEQEVGDVDWENLEKTFVSLWSSFSKHEILEQKDSDDPIAAKPNDVGELFAGLRSIIPELYLADNHFEVRWPQAEFGKRRARLDYFDGLSVDADKLVELPEHLRSVEQIARVLADCLGVSVGLAQAVQLAARFHDLGKADLRFQEVLGNPGSIPWAKSMIRSSDVKAKQKRPTGWPKGSRHELLSVQLLDAWIAGGAEIADVDLVRHLILSHHGHGRPWCLAPGKAGEFATSFSLDGDHFDAPTNPSLCDLDQPRRFRTLNEKYGYWGLALLECIVRQADHLVSELTEVL
jgi:CRISPR-associated endonuclease/helicase Cas3